MSDAPAAPASAPPSMLAVVVSPDAPAGAAAAAAAAPGKPDAAAPDGADKAAADALDAAEKPGAAAAADDVSSAPPCSTGALFRFATPADRALLACAVVCAMGHGVVMPLFSLLFGQIINGLNSGTLAETVKSLCLQLMGVAIAAGFCAYCQFALANVAAVRQTRALRLAYVAALLRQDVAWHDAHPPGESAARLVEDTVTVEEGLGAKLTMAAQGATTFLAGFILAFSLSWKMSLVLLGFLPLLGGVMAVVTTKLMGADKKGADAYAEAGDVAAEALANLRTVAAYGGEADAAARYERALTAAEREGVRKATLTGVIMGTMLCVLFCVYGCSLLWGAQLVIWSRAEVGLTTLPGGAQVWTCVIDPARAGCFTGGTVMQVLFALIMGAGALGQMAPSVTALTAARAAGGRIFALLDRVPPIDSAPRGGAAAALAPPPPAVPAGAARGRIEFRNVSFSCGACAPPRPPRAQPRPLTPPPPLPPATRRGRASRCCPTSR